MWQPFRIPDRLSWGRFLWSHYHRKSCRRQRSGCRSEVRARNGSVQQGLRLFAILRSIRFRYRRQIIPLVGTLEECTECDRGYRLEKEFCRCAPTRSAETDLFLTKNRYRDVSAPLGPSDRVNEFDGSSVYQLLLCENHSEVATLVSKSLCLSDSRCEFDSHAHLPKQSFVSDDHFGSCFDQNR